MTRPVRPPFNQRIAQNLDRARIRNIERRIMYGDWINVGDPSAPAFQGTFANSGTGTGTSDELTRFRWKNGLGSGIDIQINVTGGAPGQIIFTLPANYWIGAKQSFAGVDDAGNPVCYTIVPRIDGSNEADVYLGRV